VPPVRFIALLMKCTNLCVCLTSVPFHFQNFMCGGNVQLLGDTAVVTATRLVQAVDSTKSMAETRVWQRGTDKKWRQVHFHRSSA